MTVDVRRLAGLSGSFFGTGLCLAFGVYNGVQQLTVITTLPWLVVEIVTVSAVPAVLVFTVLATLSGLMLTREVFSSPDPNERLTEGPPITAIVPVYGDGDVLRTSVESLLESNYSNVSVAIVTESGDDETIAVAEELASHPDVQILTNRRPGSKARAINDAVSRLDAEYFCAFDADEWVDPDFVPTAMYALVEADRDVFQARRVPRANGPIETLAYCERLLFHASYKLVEPLGFTYCRSSSSAFTREAFDAVGGLNDVVTEDIDFAHTCFRQGLDVRQARNLTNEMEAPHTMRDLWGQRKRWRLGHIEVFQKAVTGGFEPSGLRGAASTLRLATSLTASLFMVALVSKVAVLAYYGYAKYALLPLVAVAVTVLPVLYYDSRKGHVPDLSWSALLAPLVYPGFGIVTIRCAFEYVFSWDGEWYQVEKTGT